MNANVQVRFGEGQLEKCQCRLVTRWLSTLRLWVAAPHIPHRSQALARSKVTSKSRRRQLRLEVVGGRGSYRRRTTLREGVSPGSLQSSYQVYSSSAPNYNQESRRALLQKDARSRCRTSVVEICCC